MEPRGDCSKETKMRKVVASLFMTLDGVVEAPEGWNSRFADGEMEAVLTERMAEQDTILLGRRTCEDFSQTWPVSVSPLAPEMNATRKVVVSETLPAVAWQNAVLIEEPIADQLPKLKQMNGRNIEVMGSVTLVQSLLRRGLLDELRLLVHPVTVGSGRRLVEGSLAGTRLQLMKANALSSGVLDLAYAPRLRDLVNRRRRDRRHRAGGAAQPPADRSRLLTVSALGRECA
jgi:dihydrofolate reductase